MPISTCLPSSHTLDWWTDKRGHTTCKLPNKGTGQCTVSHLSAFIPYTGLMNRQVGHTTYKLCGVLLLPLYCADVLRFHQVNAACFCMVLGIPYLCKRLAEWGAIGAYASSGACTLLWPSVTQYIVLRPAHDQCHKCSAWWTMRYTE